MSSFGDRASDRLTSFVGSWTFVIGQAAFLAIWFTLNTLAATRAIAWDRYPFILANLFMSAEAAFTGPIILMSTNRSSAADSAVLRLDYQEDSETNRMVEKIAEKLGIPKEDA